MRAARDRLRQALLFEIIGLIVAMPLGALAFGVAMQDFGVVALVGSTLATAWNYLYNLAFDHVLMRWSGSLRKSLRVRVGHAVLFELGLLVMLAPFIAWYLEATLVQALLMDVSLAVFYLVYAFLFTWAYDSLFPPEPPAQASDAD